MGWAFYLKIRPSEAHYPKPNASHCGSTNCVLNPIRCIARRRTVVLDLVNFTTVAKSVGMESKEIIEHRSSIAAPLIFIIVIVFQLLAGWLERLKKRSSKSDAEIELRQAIKQLLKEASSLSQPSTFAQAAKLRRLAATKERELANYQESRKREMKVSFGSYHRVLLISKVLIYLALIFWFWRVSVATIPNQLVQPFGKLLSWRAGGAVNDYVKVGIVPWLILSTRVSKFVCRVFI